jgi:hypothetical protein
MGILILFDHPIRNWIDSAGTVYFNALDGESTFPQELRRAIAPIVKAIPNWKNLGLFLLGLLTSPNHITKGTVASYQ